MYVYVHTCTAPWTRLAHPRSSTSSHRDVDHDAHSPPPTANASASAPTPAAPAAAAPAEESECGSGWGMWGRVYIHNVYIHIQYMPSPKTNKEKIKNKLYICIRVLAKSYKHEYCACIHIVDVFWYSWYFDIWYSWTNSDRRLSMIDYRQSKWNLKFVHEMHWIHAQLQVVCPATAQAACDVAWKNLDYPGSFFIFSMCWSFGCSQYFNFRHFQHFDIWFFLTIFRVQLYSFIFGRFSLEPDLWMVTMTISMARYLYINRQYPKVIGLSHFVRSLWFVTILCEGVCVYMYVYVYVCIYVYNVCYVMCTLLAYGVAFSAPVSGKSLF